MQPIYVIRLSQIQRVVLSKIRFYFASFLEPLSVYILCMMCKELAQDFNSRSPNNSINMLTLTYKSFYIYVTQKMPEMFCKMGRFMMDVAAGWNSNSFSQSSSYHIGLLEQQGSNLTCSFIYHMTKSLGRHHEPSSN